MKKLLFMSLLSISFMLSASIAETLYTIFGPVPSIEKEAQQYLNFFYQKNADGSYKWHDDIKSYEFGITAGTFRNKFLLGNRFAINKLSKALLLKKYNRLMKIGAIAKDPHGGPSELHIGNIDYEYLWQQQPLKDRLWWTIRHRQPCTYGLSLLKWGTELGIIYGVYRLAKWYKAINITGKS